MLRASARSAHREELRVSAAPRCAPRVLNQSTAVRLAVVIVAALTLGCGRSSDQATACDLPPAPSSTPVGAGGLGDPCGRGDASCAVGLACQSALGVAAGFSFSACTVGCQDAGCPSGSACVSGDLGPVCLPSCTSDSACQASVRAGTCVSRGDGGVCEPMWCKPLGYGGPSCAGAYTCVDFGPCGCDPRHPCDESPGWCERTTDGG